MREMNTGENQRRVTFLAPDADVDRLREMAEAEHRTLSQELRRLIAAHIAKAEAELKAAA
jgi:hypothetical protein